MIKIIFTKMSSATFLSRLWCNWKNLCNAICSLYLLDSNQPIHADPDTDPGAWPSAQNVNLFNLLSTNQLVTGWLDGTVGAILYRSLTLWETPWLTDEGGRLYYTVLYSTWPLGWQAREGEAILYCTLLYLTPFFRPVILYIPKNINTK